MNTVLAPATSKVSLRPRNEADAAFLFSVYASTRAEELAQTGWETPQKESFLRMQYEAQRRCYDSDYPGAEFLIILVDGKGAGRLYAHRRVTEIRVMDIALLPEFRGRGIGTGLLRGLLEEGARTKRRVSIHVEAFNPALRLYERLGFQQVSSTGVYHLLEWSPSTEEAH